MYLWLTVLDVIKRGQFFCVDVVVVVNLRNGVIPIPLDDEKKFRVFVRHDWFDDCYW